MIMTSIIAVYLSQQLKLFGNSSWSSLIIQPKAIKVGLLSFFLLFLKQIIDFFCIFSVVYCSLNGFTFKHSEFDLLLMCR